MMNEDTLKESDSNELSQVPFRGMLCRDCDSLAYMQVGGNVGLLVLDWHAFGIAGHTLTALQSYP